MKLDELKIGLALTGSFCTLNTFIDTLDELTSIVQSITPIFSETVSSFDTRFSTPQKRKELIEGITKQTAMTTIIEAEHVGPKNLFDILVVAPCTGNTMAKIASAITDTTVTMAVKSHLRNHKPVVLGISSNDILGFNAKNLGMLLNCKNIYFVPFYQDDPINKENSITFRTDLLLETIEQALLGKQLQPLLQVGSLG